MDISEIGGVAVQPDGKSSSPAGTIRVTSTSPIRPPLRPAHGEAPRERIAVDKSFGLRVGSNGQQGTGYYENDFDGQDQPAAVLVQPDGKIVVGGNSFRDNNTGASSSMR